MRARCPASSSNLGPGFDVLGLALDLHVEVEVRPAAVLSVRSEGEGAELAGDASHLAARVASEILGHDRLEITVRSNIPVARGLGSSAALAAATAAAAGAEDPLAIASAYDGHPENAAASVLGGLIAASLVEGRPVARRLPLDPELAFVVVVPDRELATKTARSVLPEQVAFGDATFNLGRLGLLLAGLADRHQLVAAAGEDRLHQQARAALFPEAPELLRLLVEGGATIACWSGAGPALLALCHSRPTADKVRDAGENALSSLNLPGRSLVLGVDFRGLTVSKD